MTTTDATSPAPRDEPQGTDTLLGFAADESAPPEESKQKGWSRRRWTLTLLGLVVGLIAIVGALLGWYLRTGKPLTQLPGLAQQEKAPHYLFSMYGSTQPLGVTVSADGERIYATESGGKRVVHIYDRAGHETGTLAPPASTGAVHVPVYVAISPISGEIYVSDRMTSAIYVYASDGKYSRVFTPSGEAVGQWAPLGLAFDRDGRLYVTDVRGSGGHRLLVRRCTWPTAGSHRRRNGRRHPGIAPRHCGRRRQPAVRRRRGQPRSAHVQGDCLADLDAGFRQLLRRGGDGGRSLRVPERHRHGFPRPHLRHRPGEQPGSGVGLLKRMKEVVPGQAHHGPRTCSPKVVNEIHCNRLNALLRRR